jgi:hypothetical protein
LSSISNSNQLRCSECKLYKPTTKLCRLNNLNAFENRLDDNICGRDGKKFWALDKTNLIIAEQFHKEAGYFGLFAIISAPISIVIESPLLFWSSFISAIVGFILSDEADECKKKFLYDNGRL